MDKLDHYTSPRSAGVLGDTVRDMWVGALILTGTAVRMSVRCNPWAAFASWYSLKKTIVSD